MPSYQNKNIKRLFKSVPEKFDPRTVGTIRLGSLSFYRKHYDEAVADNGEGTGIVSISPEESVTLPAKLASALMGLEIMGESVPRPGTMMMSVQEPGISMQFDTPRKEVTISGAGCTWEFEALDALVFCMTAPSKSYSDTFEGKRIIWSIDKSDAEEFSQSVIGGINKVYPAEASFPFLSAASARRMVTIFEHGPVEYAPRELALKNTDEGRLAALLFTSATFIKPSGPPRNFENEEEYRFQFRRTMPDARTPKRLPEFIDIPFSAVEHLVKFR